MTSCCHEMFCVNYFAKAVCTEVYDMQISEAAGGGPPPGTEPCRFPKLEECAHFHYERVHLPKLTVSLQTNMDESLHSQHTNEEEDVEWFMVQVTSGDACWLVQRNLENFKMLDAQLHQCIFDRKISQLLDLSDMESTTAFVEEKLVAYLDRFSQIADNSVNCGPVLNWLQMDNKGHRLLVPSEESRSINTPAVAAAYSVRRYVSQARDELNLEVGDMISVIDMASPGESMWWRGKRGFQVGFFPQHCVHIIGDKVPRNMPLPPPVVGSLALTPIKPVLRKHGKLITFFRSFILNRPSRRRLKQSGILRERVFGCDLGEHLLNSGHDIPTVLKCCAEFIEKNGIVDGIYRLSGVTSNIQKLRNAFDEDRIPDLYTEDILQDIHSVASLLKMYFRELPNPLCTYQLYQSFVNAVQGCTSTVRSSESDHERLLKMREAVQKLPPPHYRTLEYLMRHLARVAKHGASTGMTTRNVAIVWAPNLLRCAELEVGGVAALQGVGVQAVVTEFLICYADLIFCDHLPNLDKPTFDSSLSPKKCRPKSLAISTPTKLITLEEARSKHLLNKSEECNYIEVGGGPKNLPKKYHTVIELPGGARKRGHTKRSPLGWRSFFSKARNNSQGNLNKNRKASTPGIIVAEKSVTESDLTDMKRKLRSVKSAESLTSGHSEPTANEIDILAPLHSLHKPPGHNRSVSHDSYFDTLQNSQTNSEGSLLDLSEIQLNFDLEETEMRIFSEDESLVSSPKVQREVGQRRILTRARPEEFTSATNSSNPSPKKQPRVVLSPDSNSRKRTRLEDQLSDIQYIDCNTPENVVATTTVLIHSLPDAVEETTKSDSYQPKNKSPRNSENLDKRQSLNLDCNTKIIIAKSYTEADIGGKYLGTPTPQSPSYRQLAESTSSNNSSSTEITYQHLENKEKPFERIISPVTTKQSPTYENVLTTIRVIYKSPPRSIETSPLKTQVTDLDRIYENINLLNPEKAVVPTSTASLPIQQASQPELSNSLDYKLNSLTVLDKEQRPKSLSALEDISKKEGEVKTNLSSTAVCDTYEQYSIGTSMVDKSLGSNRSSATNMQYTASSDGTPYQFVDNAELTPTDLSLSEVLHSSTENLSTTSLSSHSKNSLSPIVSPTLDFDASQDALTPVSPLDVKGSNSDYSLLNEDENSRPKSVNLIDLNSPLVETTEASPIVTNDKRKSSETEPIDDNTIYQQVKYFRRSINEVNALLDLDNSTNNSQSEHTENTVINNTEAEDKRPTSDHPSEEENYDSLETGDGHVYENVDGAELNQAVYENVDGAELKQVVYENVDINGQTAPSEDKPSVKDLLIKFEDKEVSPSNLEKPKADSISNRRKIYEKDSLPPCLRARNLKNQLKTRSLDEDEFKKECVRERRKSMDESLSYKTNSLPKTLNPPKVLPIEGINALNSLHLSHSSENITNALEEEQKKRERIEKYKEERRKYLHEKYRSESFKEDKDVLMQKLKLYKPKEEMLDCSIREEEIRVARTRRRSSRSDDSDTVEDDKCKKEEKQSTCNQINTESNKLETRKSKTEINPTKAEAGPPELNKSNKEKFNEPKSESLKARAALFEQSPVKSRLPLPCKSNTKLNRNIAVEGKTSLTNADRKIVETNDLTSDFVRRKPSGDDVAIKSERRRHTFESRERETESDRLRRVSLESRSPRKDKPTPTYNIKDMKAIFESKSKQ